MIDFIYIAGTLAFFALMIAYVAACDRLGRAHDPERETGARWQSATDARP